MMQAYVCMLLYIGAAVLPDDSATRESVRFYEENYVAQEGLLFP